MGLAHDVLVLVMIVLSNKIDSTYRVAWEREDFLRRTSYRTLTGRSSRYSAIWVHIARRVKNGG